MLIAELTERIRRTIIPHLGKGVQYLNQNHGTDLYVENPANSAEFVGRVEMTEHEFEEFLVEDLGFEPNPLAARKYRDTPNGKEYEEGSFRWLPDPNDNLNDRFQLHIRVYDGDMAPNADTGYVLVYAHWEYRWDTDPIKHYRGVEWDGEKGIAMVRERLDSHGIKYKTES